MATTPHTTYNLQRFIDAQEHSYATALAEIKNGRKESHWIWYIFPQLQGLGRSAMCATYGIHGRAEAEAYWAHPLLRQRLTEITSALLSHPDLKAEEIFSPIDARKMRSCATLFYLTTGEAIFKQVIDTFYGGRIDHRTANMLDNK